MSKSQSQPVIAWGQYLYWAHLQFERFARVDAEADIAFAIAAAAHWLAAEYVVVEGWRELGIGSAPISTLLDLYPEHCDTLRRCRNAVYHFQKTLLDDRIVKCLRDENEELTWAVALHEEFQRFLAIYAYLHIGTFEERCELADEIRRCIGWFPETTLTGSQLRVLRKIRKLEELSEGDSTPTREENRTLAAKTRRDILELRFDSHLTRLKRWPADSQ